MTDDEKNTQFETQVVHAGTHAASSAVPIYLGVNSPNSQGTSDYVTSAGGVGGPTVQALETLMCQLEHAEWCVAVASGQAAIAQTFFALLRQGDRIVVHNSVFTFATTLLREDLPNDWGVEVVWVDMRDAQALEQALQKPTRLVYFEAITNPAFHLLNTRRIVDQAHAAGALAVLDNTLLTPYLLRPLELGADLVLHSATKYLGGHGDVLAGVISGRSLELADMARRFRRLSGGFLSPHSAFLAMRGIRTLPLRMRTHEANARGLAEYLRDLPGVEEVRYVGFDDYADPEGVKPSLGGFGGMLGFRVDASVDCRRVREQLTLCRAWGSLGDLETLVAAPEADAQRDVPNRYLRIAAGLEACEDLCEDLGQAIAKSRG